MKIVIEIPKEEYKHVMMLGTIGNVTAVSNAIFNGTPLTNERCKSKNFDIVWYYGYEFDIRYCESPKRDGNIISVGTEEFRNNYLLSKYGCFVDEEARKVDDYIYCYVPETVLKTYSDEDFQKYVDKYFN